LFDILTRGVEQVQTFYGHGRGVEPVQTFCGQGEGVNFSQFCADGFNGWPLIKITSIYITYISW